VLRNRANQGPDNADPVATAPGLDLVTSTPAAYTFSTAASSTRRSSGSMPATASTRTSPSGSCAHGV
jgi:hypothetical protein